MAWSQAVAQRLRRAYHEWTEHQAEGSLSIYAAGSARRNLRRPADTQAVMRKMLSIGFELLQWFVDDRFFAITRRQRIAVGEGPGTSRPLASHGGHAERTASGRQELVAAVALLLRY